MTNMWSSQLEMKRSLLMQAFLGMVWRSRQLYEASVLSVKEIMLKNKCEKSSILRFRDHGLDRELSERP